MVLGQGLVRRRDGEWTSPEKRQGWMGSGDTNDEADGFREREPSGTDTGSEGSPQTTEESRHKVLIGVITWDGEVTEWT